MARFHWTKEYSEPSQKHYYVLRDSHNLVRAHIVPSPPPETGFYGRLFAGKWLESGPYKARQDAADWVTGILVKLEVLPATSEFGLIS